MLDAYTFTDEAIIEISNQKLISIKVDAETEYGKNLFSQYNGNAYPAIIFIDYRGKELDRFYGYLPPYEFKIKIDNVLNNINSLETYLEDYKKGNHSAELIKQLAEKYSDRGEYNQAISLFNELLLSSNQSKNDNEYAKYAIASLELKNNNEHIMAKYLLENAESSFFEKAKNAYAANLNRTAWKMAELDSNLNEALSKINKGISLIKDSNNSLPYLLDTKAEILWKLNENEKAVGIINKAILLDSETVYYKEQKEKFLKQIN